MSFFQFWLRSANARHHNHYNHPSRGENPPRGSTVIHINNGCKIPVDIHIGEMKLTAVAARERKTKRVPPNQFIGQNFWRAVFLVHGHHELVVAQGRFDGHKKDINLSVPENAARNNERLLGMSYGAYSVLTSAQKYWRQRLVTLKRAREYRKKLAAKLIQRACRAHLHRAPRRCFVCFDSVGWGTMVSLVPAKRCHRVCADCASQHVNIALSEGRMHVRCPGEGCKHLLGEATIQALASREALDARTANVEAANLRRISSLASDDEGFLQFCAQHARKCPACHVLIYRHAGCDHMTCKCGFEFDWNKTDEAKIVKADGSPAVVENKRAAAHAVAWPSLPNRLDAARARRRPPAPNAAIEADMMLVGVQTLHGFHPPEPFADGAFPQPQVLGGLARLAGEDALGGEVLGEEYAGRRRAQSLGAGPLAAPHNGGAVDRQQRPQQRPQHQQQPFLPGVRPNRTARIPAPRTRDEEDAQLAAALAASAEIYARDGP